MATRSGITHNKNDADPPRRLFSGTWSGWAAFRGMSTRRP